MLPERANGVLYKLGGAGGGLTCFFVDGTLHYEYNLFLVQRTKISTAAPVPAGDVTIEIETSYLEPRPGGPLAVTLRVNGADAAAGQVPASAALMFSANDCLDIGRAYGGAVSRAYADRMPFAFDGTIDRVHIAYAGTD